MAAGPGPPDPPGGAFRARRQLRDHRARDGAGDVHAAWGQSGYVDNKPGAAGNVAIGAVARAADGHTLLMGHIGTLAVNPSIYPKLNYDPIKSFAHVSMIARVHNVLVVNPEVPAKTTRS